ncbi:hypothetical protein [Ehrlichia canis]|uniref:hypothetical protein n=2 Tax=Ehrlichia canis TaxID=944 RepID=UPI0018F7E4DA|nr:hypothetical protein [Ehrlichia canis]
MMFRHVFNIVKKVGYVFILILYTGNVYSLEDRQVFNVKPSFSGYRYLKFLNDEVIIDNAMFCTIIKAGECRTAGANRLPHIAYFDTSNFAYHKLCVCGVSSCEDLPDEQSEWSARCETTAVCVKTVQKLLPLQFCTVLFDEKSSMRFVPIEFSRQMFFNPGIRLIVVDNGKLYKQDFFLGVGVMSRNCDVTFAEKLYKFSIYKVGNSRICASYYDQGNFLTKCVPIPALPKPILHGEEDGKIKMSFNGKLIVTQDKRVSDEIVDHFGISIVRPKINFDNHQFYLYQKCKDGKVLKLDEYCQDNAVGQIRYQHDDKVTVKCIDGINTTFGYVLKSHNVYDKHTWLKPLPNKMVRYVLTDKKQYIQCADYEYDLTNKNQDFLDSILINEDNYYFFSDEQHRNKKLNLYQDDNPCNNLKNSFYLYQNTKLKIADNKSTTLPPEVFTQFIKSDSLNSNVEYFNLKNQKILSADPMIKSYRFDTHVLRYFNVDNKEMLSLDPKLQLELQPLDYHSMGMCIDSFESTTYVPEKMTESDKNFDSALPVLQEDNKSESVLLHYPKLSGIYNVPGKCDFIKVEMLGGGESGKIDIKSWIGKEGQPGEYVMGMFKTKKSDKYFVKIYFKRMENKSSKSENDKHLKDNSDVGMDAVIEFCKKDERLHDGEVCEVQLTANGGGKLQHDIRKNVKSNNLVRDKRMLYYRVVNSHVSRRSENVPHDKRIRFIPYQNFITEALWEEIEKDECKSGKLLAENNSKYFGAGGCVDVSTGSTERGASGMVKITCEDWYHE